MTILALGSVCSPGMFVLYLLEVQVLMLWYYDGRGDRDIYSLYLVQMGFNAGNLHMQIRGKLMITKVIVSFHMPLYRVYAKCAIIWVLENRKPNNRERRKKF